MGRAMRSADANELLNVRIHGCHTQVKGSRPRIRAAMRLRLAASRVFRSARSRSWAAQACSSAGLPYESTQAPAQRKATVSAFVRCRAASHRCVPQACWRATRSCGAYNSVMEHLRHQQYSTNDLELCFNVIMPSA